MGLGRVYDKRHFRTHHCLSVHGREIPALRVEFDGDTDHGPATVELVARDSENGILLSETLFSPARVTARIWCEILPIGQGPTYAKPILHRTLEHDDSALMPDESYRVRFDGKQVT